MVSSFPYLQVAKKYDVPYSDVLYLAGELDAYAPIACIATSSPAWAHATLDAWGKEQDRRTHASPTDT
jgi:hypothetical protein